MKIFMSSYVFLCLLMSSYVFLRWDVFVKGNFEENEWVKNFRMSKDTFESLGKEAHGHIVEQHGQDANVYIVTH